MKKVNNFRTFRDVLLDEDKKIGIYMAKKHYTKPIKCMMARNFLLYKRTSNKEENFNYTDLTKNNLEDIFLQSLTNQDVYYIEECMKINNWTIKTLYNEVKIRGCNVLQVVGCPK
ncbi:hypothetical protein [Clostridium felsineum]|uniref:hypothetical protein n=1 Tax=Clostridium felsineum TaxID=36839 RepID=UPI00098BD1F5|nr:hypothetical protein [Clostridium felsineum]URZ18777.1 hypothetical protein CLFE_048650 [Clostridium felsineum DSM 794]